MSASGGQEAFFEGHAHALGVLGGVPTGKVRYDNLTSAVRQVLGFKRARVENERWVAFRSHYGIDAFYCTPGVEGAHEKGGVEGEIGRFRRNHLVPVPAVESLAELNTLIDQWDAEDDDRRIGSRPHTVGEHFAIEQPLLARLPDEPFETGPLFTPRVDRFSHLLTELTAAFGHVSAGRAVRRLTVSGRVRRDGCASGSGWVAGAGGGVGRGDRVEVGAVSAAGSGRRAGRAGGGVLR